MNAITKSEEDVTIEYHETFANLRKMIAEKINLKDNLIYILKSDEKSFNDYNDDEQFQENWVHKLRIIYFLGPDFREIVKCF